MSMELLQQKRRQTHQPPAQGVRHTGTAGTPGDGNQRQTEFWEHSDHLTLFTINFKASCKCFKKCSQAGICSGSLLISCLRPKATRVRPEMGHRRSQPLPQRGPGSECLWLGGQRSQGQLRPRGQTHQANERVWPLQGTRAPASFPVTWPLVSQIRLQFKQLERQVLLH